MPALLPLRIPAGWLVRYNAFTEDERWHHTEDLLQLSSCTLVDGTWQPDPEGFLVDLGWYPEGDPDGAYGLVVARPDFSGEIVVEARHRDPRTICEAVEACLGSIGDGASDAAIAAEVRRRIP